MLVVVLVLNRTLNEFLIIGLNLDEDDVFVDLDLVRKEVVDLFCLGAFFLAAASFKI